MSDYLMQSCDCYYGVAKTLQFLLKNLTAHDKMGIYMYILLFACWVIFHLFPVMY